MKIELIDRDYWLTIVEQKLRHTETTRQQENERMESLLWYRRLLDELRYVLQMDHTGVIYIGKYQLEALRW